MKRLFSLLAALALALPVHAHRGGSTASDLSAASMLPIAVSVVAPVAILASGAALTVVAIEAASGATVWVLERGSDGARASIRLSGDLAAGASVATGALVTVSVVGSGWILCTAGKAIAYVPNQIGKTLLHNERITR